LPRDFIGYEDPSSPLNGKGVYEVFVERFKPELSREFLEMGFSKPRACTTARTAEVAKNPSPTTSKAATKWIAPSAQPSARYIEAVASSAPLTAVKTYHTVHRGLRHHKSPGIVPIQTPIPVSKLVSLSVASRSPRVPRF